MINRFHCAHSRANLFQNRSAWLCPISFSLSLRPDKRPEPLIKSSLPGVRRPGAALARGGLNARGLVHSKSLGFHWSTNTEPGVVATGSTRATIY